MGSATGEANHLENTMLYFFIICCIVGGVMGWAIVHGGAK
jgi:hypothetical protein